MANGSIEATKQTLTTSIQFAKVRINEYLHFNGISFSDKQIDDLSIQLATFVDDKDTFESELICEIRSLEEKLVLEEEIINEGEKELLLMENFIICPTCGVGFTEEQWNTTTNDVVKGLIDDNYLITPYKERVEGTAYRCPNIHCEDEVVTDSDGVLRMQDEEGNPVKGKRKVECMNCSHKQIIEKKDVFTDINGDFVVCESCKGSFDVDFPIEE